MYITRMLSAIVLMTLVFGTVAANTDLKEPTVVLYNGNFLITERGGNSASAPGSVNVWKRNIYAIAFRGNKIRFVGNRLQLWRFLIRQFIHHRPVSAVNLHGKTVMPGIVDAHTHYLNAADSSVTWAQNYYQAISPSIPRGPMSLGQAQQILIENGFTTIGELYNDPTKLVMLQAFDNAGNLKVKTGLYLNYNGPCGDVPDFLGDWYKLHPPTRVPGETLRINGVKIMVDGGSCNRDARSYELTPGGGFGDLYFSASELTALATEIDNLGYQMAIHTIGDRAVDSAQQALAAVLAGRPNVLRHRMEHNRVIRPDQLPRYAEIGIIPTIFGWAWVCDPRVIPPAYQSWEWPYRALVDANPGLPIAWHGDDPYLGPVNPFWEMQSLVTRTEPDFMPGSTALCEPAPWISSGKLLTVPEVLTMMTINSAYALDRDKEVGSIKKGKYADLLILSRNPLSTPERELKDIKVEMTMINGTVEYCSANIASSGSFWFDRCP